MTTVCTKYIMPGKVVFVDSFIDLPSIGKEDYLYIIRYDNQGNKETSFYEYKNGIYVSLDIKSNDGDIDRELIRSIAKEEVSLHENKTIFKDHVHGLRIDGEILEYWDHVSEEWVELYSSEFQSFPRVKNLKAKSNEYGNAIIIDFENPITASYIRTEVYISDLDITTMDREQIISVADKIVDDNTTTHLEYQATLGSLYYIVAFAVHGIEGDTYFSNARSVSVLAQDVTPPGDVTDITVKPGDKKLSISWKNPTDIDFAKTRGVYKKDNPPLDMEDGIIFTDGNAEVAELSGLENEQEYFIRFYTIDFNGNVNSNESMIVSATPKEVGNVGPGPQEVIAGDSEYGFFGEVSVSELWNGQELSNLLGITQGTLQHSNEPWLKFVLDGKIIYKSKKPFRHSISWSHLNEKNVVYGDKVIEDAQGNQYKIRLMKGALTDPSKNTDSDRGAKYSEWNKLMLPIHEQAKNKNWAYPSYVEPEIPSDWNINYTDLDLVTDSKGGNGYRQWCQETPETFPTNRVIRGETGVSNANWYTASGTGSFYGWSPVLELL